MQAIMPGKEREQLLSQRLPVRKCIACEAKPAQHLLKPHLLGAVLEWASKLYSSRDEETAAWVATAAARQPSGRRQEKENMAAFLAKKREIFLVQVRTCSMLCLVDMHEVCQRSVHHQCRHACGMCCARRACVVIAQQCFELHNRSSCGACAQALFMCRWAWTQSGRRWQSWRSAHGSERPPSRRCACLRHSSSVTHARRQDDDFRRYASLLPSCVLLHLGARSIFLVG